MPQDFSYIIYTPISVHVCSPLCVCALLWCKSRTSGSGEGYTKEQAGELSTRVAIPECCFVLSCGASSSVRALAVSQGTSFLSPIAYWLWEGLEAKLFWSTMNRDPCDMIN